MVSGYGLTLTSLPTTTDPNAGTFLTSGVTPVVDTNGIAIYTSTSSVVFGTYGAYVPLTGEAGDLINLCFYKPSGFLDVTLCDHDGNGSYGLALALVWGMLGITQLHSY